MKTCYFFPGYTEDWVMGWANKHHKSINDRIGVCIHISYLWNIFYCALFSVAAGPIAWRAHFAAPCLPRDVLSRRAVLDVPDPDLVVPGGSTDLPGLPTGLHPRGFVRPARLHGWFFCHPASFYLHLHHVQGGCNTEAGHLNFMLSEIVLLFKGCFIQHF